MIELLITACLINVGECQRFSMLYDAREVSVMTCMIGGEAEVARWAESHKEWRVQRWSCGSVDERAVDT
jgi:hypothetical protein